MPVCYRKCCRSEKGVAAHASTALASAGRTHARRTGGDEAHQKGEAVRLLAHPSPRAVYRTLPRRTERDVPRQSAEPTSHTASAAGFGHHTAGLHGRLRRRSHRGYGDGPALATSARLLGHRRTAL